MSERTSETKVFSNMIWRFAQVFGAQAVSFIVSIVLARILEPEIYGTVALVTVFITILQVFVDGGMSLALVQKKQVDDLDYSSVFYFNMLMCTALYLLLFISAPVIAGFFDDQLLIPILRVLGGLLVIYGLKGVQQSYVARNYLFKRMFFATLAGNFGGAVLGIAMAIKGFGAWALVGQMLFNGFLDTLILWLTVKWRPRLMFSAARLKGLFNYGWKLLVTNLLDSVYNNLCSLIIGKKYSDADLAYYHRGKQFPTLAAYIFNSSIDSVLLPVMSEKQDDSMQVGMMARRVVSVVSFIMWPVAVGLAACAEPLVELLLTEKWLPCVPYMQILCVLCAFQPIYMACLNALKSIGRSDLFMKLELTKKFIGLALIAVSMRWGIMAMVLSEVVTLFVSHVINALTTRRCLNYGYFQQLRDIFPSMLLASVMGVMVWSISLVGLSPIISLPLQILAGVVFYTAAAAVFKLESFNYLLAIIKKLLHRKKVA